MSTPRCRAPSSLTDAAVSAFVPQDAAKPRARTNCMGQPRQINSDALFGTTDVVLIQHAGETYRLQRTRLGKLILTK